MGTERGFSIGKILSKKVRKLIEQKRKRLKHMELRLRRSSANLAQFKVNSLLMGAILSGKIGKPVKRVLRLKRWRGFRIKPIVNLFSPPTITHGESG